MDLSPSEHAAGFWFGLWHGFILVISWVVSLFSHSVNVYEVKNDGGWYNFGFVLGAGLLIQLVSGLASALTPSPDRETRNAAR